MFLVWCLLHKVDYFKSLVTQFIKITFVFVVAEISMSDNEQQQLQSLVLSAELNSENENLEQLGPIIKSIYDTGRQEAFLEQLATFVKKKEGEIERMCNSNYQV